MFCHLLHPIITCYFILQVNRDTVSFFSWTHHKRKFTSCTKAVDPTWSLLQVQRLLLGLSLGALWTLAKNFDGPCHRGFNRQTLSLYMVIFEKTPVKSVKIFSLILLMFYKCSGFLFLCNSRGQGNCALTVIQHPVELNIKIQRSFPPYKDESDHSSPSNCEVTLLHVGFLMSLEHLIFTFSHPPSLLTDFHEVQRRESVWREICHTQLLIGHFSF